MLCVQVAAFVTFLSTSFKAKLDTQFLSLSPDAGTCQAVTLTSSDTIHLDKYGNWGNSISFSQEEALFTVKFTDYQADTSAWETDMKALNAAIQEEMNFLKNNDDLPTKILHLTSWRKTIAATTEGEMLVWFNADPAYIFNTPNTQLYQDIGKADDDCKSSDSWEIQDGILTLNFDNVWSPDTPKVTDWTCPSFDILEAGFDLDYPTAQFNLIVDLQTSMTVASLGAGVIDGTDLAEVNDQFYYFGTTRNQTNINISVVFDPKFPDMQAILTVADVFFQRIGTSWWDVKFSGYYSSVVGPSNSTWNDPGFTGPFVCPASCNDEQLAGAGCSSPDFILTYTELTGNASFMVNIYANEMYTINMGKMDPGSIGCSTGDKGSHHGKLGNLEPKSEKLFAKNIAVYPFKITESYYTCTPGAVNAFFDSVGIAQGNAGLFGGIDHVGRKSLPRARVDGH